MDGIFTHAEIDELLEQAGIRPDLPLDDDQVQPTSLDLRLGPRAYRVRAGFLPTRSKVEERLKDLTLFEIDLDRGAVFEPGQIYLVPLSERLALPPDVRARSNPKSSTGRLDVFTRIITDQCERFDEVPAGYHGCLYLEVVSRSFPIRVRTGQRLNQIRFFTGQPLLSDDGHRAAHTDHRLVTLPDGSVPLPEDLLVDRGLNLGVSLRPDKDDGLIGFRARRYTGVVDLDRVQGHAAAAFFEPITATDDGRLLLEPEEFYIFQSRERIRIPPHLAAEMLAYDVGIGELRTNYAGFFDAGFGYGEQGELNGTPAVLEVRPHDVPYMVEDGQVFFRLEFYRTARPCERVYGGSGTGSNYARQGLTLAKYFVR